jgi:hypothetical protein
MTVHPDQFHETGIAVQAERIRATARLFDETTLAAMESIREAEKRLLEGTLEQARAEAMFDAATATAPHAPGLVTLLAVLDALPVTMQGAVPALINDTNIARIIGVLECIDKELTSYFADSDTAHLTNALNTGRQNLYEAMRRSFGYWQMGGGSTEPVVADLDFRPERREQLAGKVLAALEGWVPGSSSRLRGSLDSGTADDYSDIDICWVVPDEDFTDAVDTVGAALSQVTAVLSLRADPDLARSVRRRVVFARLWGVPLFWRVDIDIRTDSVAADDLYDVGNPDARSDAGWSAPASAIENAIAAIKAAARGQTDTADVLLRRGCERIGHDLESATDLADAITHLADGCVTQETRLANIAVEVRQVADRLLRSGSSGVGNGPD